jgi:recombination protein RecA
MEISCKRWSIEQKWEAAARILKLGLPEPTVTKNGFLWSGQRTRKCMEKIAEYVPRCMEYKVHTKFRNMCGRYQWDSRLNPRQELLPIQIKDIQKVPTGKHTHRFDLTVENDHTYMVDGVAVHNSPETTTGGNALKFYASVRLDVRRITGIIKDALDQPIGGHMKVKVIKNKVAPPFKECELDIIWGDGISKGADLIALGEGLGVVEKSGAWYSMDGDRLAQGHNNTVRLISEDEELQAKIRAAIEAVEKGSE